MFIASQINWSIPYINKFANFLVSTWDQLNFANREGIFDDFWRTMGGVPQNCPQLLVNAFSELLDAIESSRADAIANSRAQKIANTQSQEARETWSNPDLGTGTGLDPNLDTFNNGEAATANW